MLLLILESLNFSKTLRNSIVLILINLPLHLNAIAADDNSKLTSLNETKIKQQDSGEASTTAPETSKTPHPEIEEKSFWNKTKELGSKAFESGKKSVIKTTKELGKSQINRSATRHHILGTYSILDTWIPSKIGVSYAYNPTQKESWEIEYLRGTLSVPFIIDDLGSITDQRLSFLYRSYQDRNSFNFFYGLNYSSFYADLGSDFLAYISSGDIHKYDLVSIKTIGLTWGLGNRWQFKKGLLVSVDWLTINIPIHVLASEADFLSANANESKKEEIRDTLAFIEKIPSFAAFKFQMGIGF